ncbi:MAG: hypothetical protein ACPGQS_10335 [Bradymonadia bacterium]
MVQYIVRRDGQSYTANSDEELVNWALGGRVARSDLIHVDDGQGWRKASDLDFLKGSLSEPTKPKPNVPPVVYWTQKGHQNRLIGDLQVVVAWIKDGSLREDDLIFHAGTQSWFELRDSAFLLSVLDQEAAVSAVLPTAEDPVIESVADLADDFLLQDEETRATGLDEGGGRAVQTGPLTTEETRRIVEGVMHTEEFEVADQFTSSTTMTALSPFFNERAKVWAERLSELPADPEAKLEDRHNLFALIYDVARAFLDLKNGAATDESYILEFSSIGQTAVVHDQAEAFNALNDVLDVHLAEKAKQVLAILLPHERGGFRRYVEGVLEVMFWINEMVKPVEVDTDDTSELHTITAEAEPISRLETAIRQLILVRHRKN